MAKVGSPITDAERQSRSYKHLLQYGLKMMVRRDLGGSCGVSDYHQFLKSKLCNSVNLDSLDGDVVDNICKFVAAEITSQKNGIANRQRRTLAELSERGIMLRNALHDVKKSGTMISKDNLVVAVSNFLNGSD